MAPARNTKRSVADAEADDATPRKRAAVKKAVQIKEENAEPFGTPVQGEAGTASAKKSTRSVRTPAKSKDVISVLKSPEFSGTPTGTPGEPSPLQTRSARKKKAAVLGKSPSPLKAMTPAKSVRTPRKATPASKIKQEKLDSDDNSECDDDVDDVDSDDVDDEDFQVGKRGKTPSKAAAKTPVKAAAKTPIKAAAKTPIKAAAKTPAKDAEIKTPARAAKAKTPAKEAKVARTPARGSSRVSARKTLNSVDDAEPAVEEEASTEQSATSVETEEPKVVSASGAETAEDGKGSEPSVVAESEVPAAEVEAAVTVAASEATVVRAESTSEVVEDVPVTASAIEHVAVKSIDVIAPEIVKAGPTSAPVVEATPAPETPVVEATQAPDSPVVEATPAPETPVVEVTQAPESPVIEATPAPETPVAEATPVPETSVAPLMETAAPVTGESTPVDDTVAIPKPSENGTVVDAGASSSDYLNTRARLLRRLEAKAAKKLEKRKKMMAEMKVIPGETEEQMAIRFTRYARRVSKKAAKKAAAENERVPKETKHEKRKRLIEERKKKRLDSLPKKEIAEQKREAAEFDAKMEKLQVLAERKAADIAAIRQKKNAAKKKAAKMKATKVAAGKAPATVEGTAGEAPATVEGAAGEAPATVVGTTSEAPADVDVAAAREKKAAKIAAAKEKRDARIAAAKERKAAKKAAKIAAAEAPAAVDSDAAAAEAPAAVDGDAAAAGAPAAVQVAAAGEAPTTVQVTVAGEAPVAVKVAAAGEAPAAGKLGNKAKKEKLVPLNRNKFPLPYPMRTAVNVERLQEIHRSLIAKDKSPVEFEKDFDLIFTSVVKRITKNKCSKCNNTGHLTGDCPKGPAAEEKARIWAFGALVQKWVERLVKRRENLVAKGVVGAEGYAKIRKIAARKLMRNLRCAGCLKSGHALVHCPDRKPGSEVKVAVKVATKRKQKKNKELENKETNDKAGVKLADNKQPANADIAPLETKDSVVRPRSKKQVAVF